MVEQNIDELKVLHQFQALSSFISRATLAAGLGMSYSGKRDLYNALGFEQNPTFQQYLNFYDREPLGKRVVKAPVDATWRAKPTVKDDPNQDTDFQIKWNELNKVHRVFGQLARADRLSGIGRYGILVLGFNDGKKLEEPVERATELLYLQPYHEGNAAVAKLVTDGSDPRFGLPESYDVKVETPDGSQTHRVHHSRVLHIAENLDSSNYLGTPRLKAVLNILECVQRVAYGGSEMFWRGARPGYTANMSPDANLSETDKQALQLQLDEFENNLRRWLRLQGVEVKSLAPQFASPKEPFDILITLASIGTGIPQRILTGSERGELASSQDKDNWADVLDARRRDYVEPFILRPFIDRLVQVGVLPAPSDGDYDVEWPDIYAPSPKDQAEINRVRIETLAKYVTAPGADMVVPTQMFLIRFLGFTKEEADEAMNTINDEFSEEQQKEEHHTEERAQKPENRDDNRD